MAIYLVMGLLLLGQMLMCLALLVVGPMALLCCVLPQTYSWAHLLFSTFFATIFVQSVQALVLHLGSELIGHMPNLLRRDVGPADTGRVWLLTLFLAVAVLQLARKVPGYPGGQAAGGSQLSVLRQMSALLVVSHAHGVVGPGVRSTIRRRVAGINLNSERRTGAAQGPLQSFLYEPPDLDARVPHGPDPMLQRVNLSMPHLSWRSRS